MSDYVFKNSLAPPLMAYSGGEDLPLANADLFTLTMTGDTGKAKCGAIEICFSSTVGGTLKLKRVIGTTTILETLNFGNAVTANVPVGPEIKTFASGETLSIIYTATGGTYYLTVADVSGDSVRVAVA